ncbi:N-acetylmuramoyl-L-alanine amidase family protein [Robiginitalea sediminis]|uniref:N-acetylmuramoyl-L-alanine amidase family protein n=1 Tax=Robiginitalea sediminis TaxID=1982593 RepID=UPI000B4B792A|nr:N-acetylmuramoyl-L-alanine amidase [Robiginitalea sediminis]
MKNLLKVLGVGILGVIMAFTTSDKKTIVIDVSHGGLDSGIAANSYKEKDITLEIANKIKALNESSNMEIILTRETDEFLSIHERAEQINELNPDFVISLHVNSAADKERMGKEIFVSDKNIQKDKSGDLAIRLFYDFNDSNVQIKKADFHLLENVKHPTVLIELGYLTNNNDLELLTSEKGQMEIAKSILSAVE